MSQSQAAKAPTPQPQSTVSSSSSSSSTQQTMTTTTTTTTAAMRASSASRAASLGKDQASSSSFARHSSSHNGGRSPVSPSRVSRLQEKEDMQNLNDRLAIYIETVRRLETDNNILRAQASRYEENSQKEVLEIKTLYENELDETKRLIDELARDKARFEIDMNKHKAEAEEALAKLSKRDKESKGWEQRARANEAQALEFKSRYEALVQSSANNAEELDLLRPAHKELEKQLNKLKKQLEEETLARVDLENKNQTLKEDLTFKSSVYDKEVMQMRTSKRVEVEQADLRAREEYDSKLLAELQRIREDAEDKIQEMKDDIKRSYQNKLNEAEAVAKRNLNSSNAFKEEISTLRVRVDELQVEEKNYLKKIATLEQKCRDNEEKLRNLSQKYSKDMTDKDKDIEVKNQELHTMMIEYQDLQDIKVALDMEIAAYRKLLESEEQRLNISNISTSHMGGGGGGAGGASYLEASKTQSPTRSGKKRRLQDDSLSVGASTSAAAGNIFAAEESLLGQYIQTQQNTSGIEIDTHDQSGRQVRLVNKTTKEINVSGWKLSRKANDNKCEYKFGKSVVIKPNQHLSVWSSDAGVKQTLPHDFVMSANQKWHIADAMVTVLVDKDDNEKSRRESRKKETSEKKLIESNKSNTGLGFLGSFFR